MHDWISAYLAAQRRALESIDPDQIAPLIETLLTAWREDRQIFVAGNGGSAANASHFTTDLGKCSSDALPRRFRVLSLNDCTSWITALGNDYAYEDVFVRQLMNYARAGDVLLVASVSGNSPNVVKLLEWAREHDLRTIALVGAGRGRCAELAEQVVVIGETHYGRVEDAQMTICHLLCYAFVERPEIATGG